jgi:hypothetical protein
LDTLKKEIAATKKVIVENDADLEDLKAKTEERKSLYEEGNKKLGELKENRDQLSNKRKYFYITHNFGLPSLQGTLEKGRRT